MGVSKVNYGNSTLIDLTGDSVTPETLLENETAHDRNGNAIVGTATNINNLSTSTNTPADEDEIITKESSTWYKKAFSKVWDYTKDKIKSVLHIDDNTIDDITDIYGAKNLFNTKGNYTLFSDGAYEDPTFNSDGTIQFGSFSGGNYFGCDFTDNISFNESIDLIFTSGLTDASDSTAYIEVLYNPSSTVESVRIYNEPVLIEDVRMIDQINLVSIDGQSRLFKPMLRTANIKSDKYVPYAMTNRELTADLDTLKSNVAKKVDLTNISITGTTNSTGAKITSGTFFYLNGLLVRAKVDIASGATLTLNTNYEAVTAGGLNKLNADIATLNSDLTQIGNNKLSSVTIAVEEYINNFHTNNDTWTATDDGWAILRAQETKSGVCYVYIYKSANVIASITLSSGTGGLTYTTCFPVVKGVTYKMVMGGFDGTGVAVLFHKLVVTK